METWVILPHQETGQWVMIDAEAIEIRKVAIDKAPAMVQEHLYLVVIPQVGKVVATTGTEAVITIIEVVVEAIMVVDSACQALVAINMVRAVHFCHRTMYVIAVRRLGIIFAIVLLMVTQTIIPTRVEASQTQKNGEESSSRKIFIKSTA